MKKVIALVVLMCMMLSIGCAFAGSDRVVIYTAAEDERIAYLQEKLDAQFPDVEIVIQSLGTGQLLSRQCGDHSECLSGSVRGSFGLRLLDL